MATTPEQQKPQLNGTAPVPAFDIESPEVESPERVRQEWMMIAVGLIALMSLLAIVLSIVAIGSKSRTSTTVTRVVAPAAGAGAGGAAAATAVAKPMALAIAIKSDTEHGKLGPGGTWHDAFLPANFTVHAGQKVTVTVTNYDSGAHTFTSPSMTIQQTIAGGGSMANPKVVTFTFIAPKTAGTYQWWCAMPCDPWAMKHVGYMRGIVTVKA